MRRRFLLIVGLLGIILLALLAFFLRDFFRQNVVEPLFEAAWVLRLAFYAIPQPLLWTILILLGLLVGFRSLYERRSVRREAGEIQPEFRGRVGNWARWIQLAQEGEYFKLHLARELGDLTIDVLAYREAERPALIRSKTLNGEIKAPLEILEFLDTRLSRYNFSRFQRLAQRFRLGGHSPVHEMGFQPIVKFLETELEINNEQ